MVRLLIVRAVPAAPGEVRAAYRRSIEDRPTTADRVARSEVRTLAEGQLRFTSEGDARVGRVKVDGVVTWTGDDGWTCRREVEVDGHPFSWEIEHYHVAPREGGCDLTLSSEIHARGPLQEVLLIFGRGRLLVQRHRELDRWLPGSGPKR